MAERLGLPASVVQDARARRDDKEAQAEALLARLEREKSELEGLRARTEADRIEVESLLAEQKKAEKDLHAKKRAELETFARELKRRGEEASRKAAEAIREAVKRVEDARRSAEAEATKARGTVVAAIQAAQGEALQGTGAPEVDEVEMPSLPLAVGQRVRVKTMGIVGEVLALPNTGTAEVAVGGKRWLVAPSDLIPLSGGPAAKPARSTAPGLAPPTSPRLRGGGISVTANTQAPAEINLLGLTVDEALPRVDKLLDEATLSNRTEVRIIHGFGAGKLKKAVASFLKDHPNVASFRPGGAKEGGGGATIVEIKE
jgi:DNA mismatch repair protein MutS2